MLEPVKSLSLSLNIDKLSDTKNDRVDKDFSSLLRDNIQKVNDLQLKADSITEDFALGKIDNIHTVTIATEKARVALNLTLALQNKIVQSYQEIMRMQV